MADKRQSAFEMSTRTLQTEGVLDLENSDDRIALITQTRNRQHLIEESLTKRKMRMRREKTYPMSSGRY